MVEAGRIGKGIWATAGEDMDGAMAAAALVPFGVCVTPISPDRQYFWRFC
jgi:hypothetical protein